MTNTFRQFLYVGFIILQTCKYQARVVHGLTDFITSLDQEFEFTHSFIDIMISIQ